MKNSDVELIITRGLQGSGKTTWAIAQVKRDPKKYVRVNRDNLRMSTYGSYWLDNDPDLENMISEIQYASIRAALQRRRSVIVDDTNLRGSTVSALHAIAVEFGGRVQFRVQDFEVDVDECIRRDAIRVAAGERGVGAQVIRDTANRYLNGGSSLPKLDAKYYERIVEGQQFDTYIEDESLPSAWLVDIDGTIANMVGRGPYEFHRVDEDEPVEGVIDIVKMLKNAGHTIIIMSGREDSCMQLTRDWLDVYEVPYDHLYMRKTGDRRRDNFVKEELFETHIRGKFYIRGCLDDRDQVVKQYRKMGLLVAQVAYGAF